MTWREELRPASFRGVPFHVDVSARTLDLHADEQVFPGRDDPGDAVHVEHLGVGAERFRVDAFVFGDDVFEKRDALEHVLGQPGSGRLIHPYRGERIVSVVGAVTTNESRKQGGVVRISFTVVVTESPTIRRAPDTAALAERDLDAFLDELARDFTETFEEGAPEVTRESSIAAIERAIVVMAEVYSTVIGVVGIASDFAADVGRGIERAGSDPLDLVQPIIQAAGVIASLPERAARTALSLEQRGGTVAAQVVAAMQPLVRFGALIEEATTRTRQIERKNHNATINLIRGAAIGQLARAAVRLPYDSRVEATGARDALVEALDRLVEESSASGDTATGAMLYEAIADARASLVQHLSTIAQTLPEVTTYAVPSDLPALVIAHLLYGDGSREADLVARNDPPTPGLVPAGTVLEVLRG